MSEEDGTFICDCFKCGREIIFIFGTGSVCESCHRFASNCICFRKVRGEEQK